MRLTLFLFASLAASFGQVATSRLEGTVQDASGAVIANARVTVDNNKTKVRAEMFSGAEGRFMFPSLVPGEYTVTVDAPGFRRFVVSDLVLNVGDSIEQKIRMEVGDVTESIVVQAEAVRVQITEAQISQVVTLKDIATLPQLGRNPLVLAVFQPGVQIDPDDSSYSRVNGLRQGSNNSRLDGIDVNDPVAPRLGLSHNATNPDALAEFRIVTNGGKAEYGRSAGGQVEMITRSGTNKWSGNAFEYLRNEKLHANNFFNNSSGVPRPKYIQNQFGGSLGGPILRDRTFIFGNYQGSRVRQGVVRNRTVLTPEAKRGLFRWRAPGSANIQTFDIVRNDPRGKGIDPEIGKILQMLPDPNNTDVGDGGLNTAGFRFNAPASSYNDQLTIKGDHNVSSGHRVFMRYSWFRTQSIDTLNGHEARYPGQPQGVQGGHRWGYSIGSDWSLRPTVVNELRFGYRAANTDFIRPARPKGVAYISNSWTDPVNPSFSQGRNSPIYDITENITFVRGKHTLKAGANLRFLNQHGWRDDGIYPDVTFSRSFGNAPPANIGPTGSTISSADRQRFENLYNDLLGRMSQVTQTFYSNLETFLPAGVGRMRDLLVRESGYFIQDDWKVRPNFTVNIGLRYEFFGVPTEKDKLLGSLDKIKAANDTARIADFSVQRNTPWYGNDWNNFAPRFGFAWDVTGDGKTALRGGYGIFYDRIIGSTINGVDTNTPGFSQAAPLYPNQAANSDRRVSDGVPLPVKPDTPVLRLAPTRSTTIRVFNPNFRTGYVHEFNLDLQREIYRNTVVEVAYVATRGVKLFMNRDLNQPRIYEDFLRSFRELQAFQASGAAVPAGNTLVRVFGSAATAISTLGASNIRDGIVGTAATTLDRSNYTRYAAAGVSDFYLRNFPQYNQFIMGSNDGRSYYNSLQLRVRRQMGALKVNANYTYGKVIDNGSAEGNGYTAPIDSYNLLLNRGPGDYDIRHSFNASFIYALPFLRRNRWLGGWEMGVLNVWQTGSAFTIGSGRATTTGVTTWANYSGDRKIGSVNRTGNGVYLYTPEEVARFSLPGAGEFGNTGRNAFYGPRYFDVDLSLVKRFRITENHSITYRAEAYNLFNNVNFGTLGTTATNPQSLGKFSDIYGNPRIMQMALRYDF